MDPTPKCPNCGKTVDIVDTNGAAEILDVAPARVNMMRAENPQTFPTPWLDQGNRRFYLRTDIEQFREVRSNKRINALADAVAEQFARLDPEAVDNMLEALRESLKTKMAQKQDGAAPRRRKNRQRRQRARVA